MVGSFGRTKCDEAGNSTSAQRELDRNRRPSRRINPLRSQPQRLWQEISSLLALAEYSLAQHLSLSAKLGRQRASRLVGRQSNPFGPTRLSRRLPLPASVNIIDGPSVTFQRLQRAPKPINPA